MRNPFRAVIPFVLAAAVGAPALGQALSEDAAKDDLAVAASPLAGLDEAGVRARVGQPTLARAEGAGALWTYRLPTCALFVYFTDAGDGLRVTGASTGPRRHGDPAPLLDACLSQAATNRIAASPPAEAAP